EILPGLLHRLPDIGAAREVDHGFRLIRGHHLVEATAVAEVAFRQRPPAHRPAMSRLQIVEGDRFEAGLGEPLGRVAADVPGAASDEYAHVRRPSCLPTGAARPYNWAHGAVAIVPGGTAIRGRADQGVRGPGQTATRFRPWSFASE